MIFEIFFGVEGIVNVNLVFIFVKKLLIEKDEIKVEYFYLLYKYLFI